MCKTCIKRGESQKYEKSSLKCFIPFQNARKMPANEKKNFIKKSHFLMKFAKKSKVSKNFLKIVRFNLEIVFWSYFIY